MGFFGVPAYKFDSANFAWKMMDDRGEGYSTLNMVASISEAEYKRAMAQNRGNTQEFSFIKWRGNHYVLGESAIPYGGYQSRLTGKPKFTRDYIGLAMIHCALTLSGGKLPPQFAVMGAHPPLDAEQKENIVKALKGKWKFSVFGVEYETEVTFVDSVDEITGGAMNVLLNDKGNRMQSILAPQDTLVFDCGGGTTDIVLLNTAGIPVKGTYNGLRVGMNDAVLEFQQSLNEEYGKLFKNAKGGIPLKMVYDIALHPEKKLVNWAGKPLDCANLWQESIAPTLAQLHAGINQMLEGSITLSAPQVLLTGGGSALIEDELKESLFPIHAENNRIFRAIPDKSKMIYANVQGMYKYVNALRIQERQAK